MKHIKMDRKSFLKWLGTFFIGLIAGRRFREDSSGEEKKYRGHEAQFYKSADRLAG